MEVFSWHEGLGKWIEIANVSPQAGAVQRSHLLCLHLHVDSLTRPSSVRYLPSRDARTERPTMIKYKISDIRTLVGHKTDLDSVKKRAAVRLEKGDD
jgi:phenylalanyl-tRNA synthetase alpha chain